MKLPLPRIITYELYEVRDETPPLKRSTTCLCGKTIPKSAKRVIAVYAPSEGFWNLYRLVHDENCAPAKFERHTSKKVSERWYDYKGKERRLGND